MSANKKLLIPLFVIVFLDMVGVGIVIPILAPLLVGKAPLLIPDAPEATRNMILGFLIASFSMAQFFGAPILGALSDRYGRKKILIVSLTGTLLGYLLFGLAILQHNLALLFFSRCLDGFTGGNISVAMSAIADVTEERDRAANFGLVGMAFGLGFILGPFLGGKLANPEIVSWFGYETPFWFAAILCFLAISLVFALLPETLRTKSYTPISFFTGFKNIGRALQMPKLRTIFGVIFLITLGFNFFTQFFQVYLIHAFAFTTSNIGDLFAYIGLWIAFTQGFLTRFISRRFRPEQVLKVSPFILGIALLSILGPDEAWMLLFVMPFVAISNGLTYPNATAVISNLSDPSAQGEVMGINQSIQALGQAIPPIIAGFIVSMHQSLPILVAGGLMLLGWVVYLFSFQRGAERH